MVTVTSNGSFLDGPLGVFRVGQSSFQCPFLPQRWHCLAGNLSLVGVCNPGPDPVPCSEDMSKTFLICTRGCLERR